MAYLYRSSQGPVPLTRLIDARQNADLLANGIIFTRPKARQLFEQVLRASEPAAAAAIVAAMAAIQTLASLRRLQIKSVYLCSIDL